MRFDATVAGRTIRVEVRRENDHYAVTLDGTPLGVDLIESGDHFASLIVDGLSHEVGLERRPDGYRVHLPAATESRNTSPAPASANTTTSSRLSFSSLRARSLSSALASVPLSISNPTKGSSAATTPTSGSTFADSAGVVSETASGAGSFPPQDRQPIPRASRERPDR